MHSFDENFADRIYDIKDTSKLFSFSFPLFLNIYEIRLENTTFFTIDHTRGNIKSYKAPYL